MTASRLHLVMAGLMGAFGVILWSMAAHRPGGASLVTSAQFLLFHSPVIMAITACRKLELLANRLASLAVAAMVLGALLFCGDISLRHFAGAPLFAKAAPIGGSLTILGWFMVVLAALVSPQKKI